MFAGFPSMERRHDRSARDFSPGPSANDNALVAGSALPLDARAIVEPVPIATNQGGRAGHGRWRVRFQPRWGPSADPLTGWTGGGDPLDTIQLRFPDRLSAEAYCRRQGLAFRCHGETNVSQDGSGHCNFGHGVRTLLLAVGAGNPRAQTRS